MEQKENIILLIAVIDEVVWPCSTNERLWGRAQ